ncbi:MAG: hydroxymethylglutaryl-CoA synthase [Streptococcaceae bacterium]|jgi:hydroxymethylglutaryl-CoA synthase|nr:hydroxymethylglutaryl-CoA synthase [Streptococcaceae bacterium]
MKIGIDKINFYVPQRYIDMTDLAEARGVDPAKFHIGLGQDQMAVTTANEDIITLGANAASEILTAEDRAAIDLVIVGTESSVDESKASAVILHNLLGIQPFARAYEIKEACYSGTAALMMAKQHVEAHPEQKALVIAADIARYGLNSSGEPTQGAGAVAMLVSVNPSILALEDDSVALSQDIYDFWRPTGEAFPRVEGKLSNETYIDSFSQVWDEYKVRTGLDFSDFAALAFHTPYTKMGKKALQPQTDDAHLFAEFENAIAYNRRVGNLYTGSLYLSLISLLENSTDLKEGQRIGLFSYGSGAVAEFFSAKLVDGFEQHLRTEEHRKLLDSRQKLTIAEYEQVFTSKEILPSDEKFSLSEISGGVRYYN